MALADFLERLHLAQRLDTLAESLRAEGRGALAAEYAQLWELTVGALEQFAAILGDTQMDADTFATLFLRMLSCYDIGTIPVALDRVTAGDLDRMRRRGIRHLIVLGASDDRLPRAGEPDGVFSPEERRELLELELDIGGGTDDALWREYNLIYQCVTLPAETLAVSYPLFDGNGTPTRPSFLVTRIAQLFRHAAPPREPGRAAPAGRRPGAGAGRAHAARGDRSRRRRGARVVPAARPRRARRAHARGPHRPRPALARARARALRQAAVPSRRRRPSAFPRAGTPTSCSTGSKPGPAARRRSTRRRSARSSTTSCSTRRRT